MTIKIGDWIAISGNGIWISPFEDKYCLSTKMCAVEDIRCAKLDARNKHKIRRVTAGEYEYSPKSTDTCHDGDLYTIIKVNRENIAQYRLLIESLENADIK